MKRIVFHDLSDTNGDKLEVTDRETEAPSLTFRASTPRTIGIVAVLNYSQVFKLRDKLNEFLAEKFGAAPSAWTEDA